MESVQKWQGFTNDHLALRSIPLQPNEPKENTGSLRVTKAHEKAKSVATRRDCGKNANHCFFETISPSEAIARTSKTEHICMEKLPLVSKNFLTKMQENTEAAEAKLMRFFPNKAF